MIRKFLIVSLIILYIFHLNFSIFLNEYFRLPTPLLFGVPLIILFNTRTFRFLYWRELFWLVTASFFINYIGNENPKDFFIDSLTIAICALFFNYFVGSSKKRFEVSIIVFYSLLVLSTCVLFLNHLYGTPINIFRSQLLGAPISQSPSGISGTIFSFGYQLATLVTFLLVFVFIYKKSLWVKGVVVILCLTAIYLGLQRSVLVTFVTTSVLFFVAYYKLKSLPIMFFIGVAGIFLSSFFLQETSNYDNIFAKNERKGEENREDLTIENLNIITEYPFGLVFYGKTWWEVTRDNPVYRGGLTSHNAYLMFITYLGPFLGGLLLLMIYYRIGSISRRVLLSIREPENALLACLCLSFLAVSLNSFFHNGWLVGANGQTVFLYFAIFNLIKHQTRQSEVLES